MAIDPRIAMLGANGLPTQATVAALAGVAPKGRVEGTSVVLTKRLVVRDARG